LQHAFATLAPHFTRSLEMGNHRKCVHCDRPAIAYRLEDDGGRVYLCEDHIPCGENENIAAPKLRLVQPPNTKAERG
jgi:hypothetical protein